MKKLVYSCLAVGALAAAAIGHATVAKAEPLSLTEAEMDGVTAGTGGFEVGSPQWVANLLKKIKEDGKRGHRMTVIFNGKKITKLCAFGKSCKLFVRKGEVKFRVVDANKNSTKTTSSVSSTVVSSVSSVAVTGK